MPDEVLAANAAAAPAQPILGDVLQTTQKFIEGTETRQSLIRDIEAATNRRLLVYHAAFDHQQGMLLMQDLNTFMDLVQSLPSGRVPIDLMINTPGGDANTSEQILNVLYQHASSLRVIVPRAAKSAGTLLALGAREIVMGPASELGPVDPQFAIVVGGLPRYIPAQAFIDSQQELLDQLHDAQFKNAPGLGYITLLQTINVAFVNDAKRLVDHAKKMGERWLVKNMYPGDQVRASDIMGRLVAANVNYSHGRVFDGTMAKDEIGLRVRILRTGDPLWRMYWRLHLLNEFWLAQAVPAPGALRKVKLFESATVSLAQIAPTA